MLNERRWILVALGIAAACGAPSKAPPPQTPEPARGAHAETTVTGMSATPTDQSLQRPTVQPEAEPAPSPPPASPATAPPSESSEAPGAVDPHTRYTRARVQFSEARREVDIAAGQRDCANACRALDSMERAMAQLCELARSDQERHTCKSAEDQVSSARERVRNACGECLKKMR
jgi:hypothetical protein